MTIRVSINSINHNIMELIYENFEGTVEGTKLTAERDYIPKLLMRSRRLVISVTRIPYFSF